MSSKKMDTEQPEKSVEKKVEKIQIKTDPDGSKTNEAKEKSRIENKRARWKKELGNIRTQPHSTQSSSVKREPDADNQSATDTSKIQENDDDDIIELPIDPYSCRRTSVYIQYSKTYVDELQKATEKIKLEIKEENSPNALKRKSLDSNQTKNKKIKTEEIGMENKPVKIEPGVNPAEPVRIPSLVNLKPVNLKKCFVCVDQLEESTDPLAIRWKQSAKNSSASKRSDSFSSNNLTPEKQSPNVQQKIIPKDKETSPKLVDKPVLQEIMETQKLTVTIMQYKDNTYSVKPKESFGEHKDTNKLEKPDSENTDKVEMEEKEDDKKDAMSEDSQDDLDTTEELSSDKDSSYSPNSLESEENEDSETSNDNYETPDNSDMESNDYYETPNGSDNEESHTNKTKSSVRFVQKDQTKIEAILADPPSVVLIRLESITTNYINLPAKEMEQKTDEYVKNQLSDNFSCSSYVWNSRAALEDSPSGDLCIDESRMNDSNDTNTGAEKKDKALKDGQESMNMEVSLDDKTKQLEDTSTKSTENKDESILTTCKKVSVDSSDSKDETVTKKSIEIITLDDNPDSPVPVKSPSTTSMSQSKSKSFKRRDSDVENRTMSICVFCKEEFKALNRLKLHFENKHPLKYRNKALMAKHGYNFDGSNECSICEVKFETQVALFDHLCKHTPEDYQEAAKKHEEAQMAKKNEWHLNETNKVPEAAKENEIQDNGQIVVTKSKKLSAEVRSMEPDSVLSPNNPRTTPKLTTEQPVMAEIKICSCHESETPRFETHIEILISCTTCNTHFRRGNCIEFHYRNSAACGKNRTGRSARVFCSLCKCLFDEVPNLRQHIQLHLTRYAEQKITYVCDICQVVFYGNESMMFYNHWSDHIKSPNFICSKYTLKKKEITADQTDLSDQTRRLLRDYVIVAEYSCKKCSQSFQDNAALDDHKLNHCKPSKPESMQICCGPCWKKFHKKEDYVAHRDTSNHLIEVKPLYRTVQITSNGQMYVCNLCRSMYASVEEMTEHFVMKHGRKREFFNCLIPNCKDKKQMPITELDEHYKKLHKNQLYQYSINYISAKYHCEGCNYGFDEQKDYQEHKQQHALTKNLNVLLQSNTTPAVVATPQVLPTYTPAVLPKPQVKPMLKQAILSKSQTQPGSSSSANQLAKTAATQNDAGTPLVGKTILLGPIAATPTTDPASKSTRIDNMSTVRVSSVWNVPNTSGGSTPSTVQNDALKSSIQDKLTSFLGKAITPAFNSAFKIQMLPSFTKAATSTTSSPRLTTAAKTTTSTAKTIELAPATSSVPIASVPKSVPETSIQPTASTPILIPTVRFLKIKPIVEVPACPSADSSTQNQPAIEPVEELKKKLHKVGKKIFKEMKAQTKMSILQLGSQQQPEVLKSKLREQMEMLLTTAKGAITADVQVETSRLKQSFDQLIKEQVEPFFSTLEQKILQEIDSKFSKKAVLPNLGPDEDLIVTEESSDTASQPNTPASLVENQGDNNSSVATPESRPASSFDNYAENRSPDEDALVIDESMDTNEIPAASNEHESQPQPTILAESLNHEPPTSTSTNPATDKPPQPVHVVVVTYTPILTTPTTVSTLAPIVVTYSPVVSTTTPAVTSTATQNDEIAQNARQTLENLIEEMVKNKEVGLPSDIDEDISQVVSVAAQTPEQLSNQEAARPLLRVKDLSELTSKTQNTDTWNNQQQAVQPTQVVQPNVQKHVPNSSMNARNSPMTHQSPVNSLPQMTNVQRNSPNQVMMPQPPQMNSPRYTPTQIQQTVLALQRNLMLRESRNQQMIRNSSSNLNQQMVQNSSYNLNHQMVQNSSPNLNQQMVQNSSPNLNQQMVQNAPANLLQQMIENMAPNLNQQPMTMIPNSNGTMGTNGSYTIHHRNSSVAPNMMQYQNNYPSRTCATPAMQQYPQQMYRPPVQNVQNHQMMQGNMNPRMANAMMQQQMQPMTNLARPGSQQEMEARARAVNSARAPPVRPPPAYSVRPTGQVNAPSYNGRQPLHHPNSRPNTDSVPYSCSACMNFSSLDFKEIEQHMKKQCLGNYGKTNEIPQQTQLIYECNCCLRYRTSDMNQFQRHKSQCHPKSSSSMQSPDMSEMVFLCKYCPPQPPIIFQSALKFNDHLFRVHNIVRT